MLTVEMYPVKSHKAAFGDCFKTFDGKYFRSHIEAEAYIKKAVDFANTIVVGGFYRLEGEIVKVTDIKDNVLSLIYVTRTYGQEYYDNDDQPLKKSLSLIWLGLKGTPSSREEAVAAIEEILEEIRKEKMSVLDS